MIPRISRWLSWIGSCWVNWKGRWTAKRWRCAISTTTCFTLSSLNEMLRIVWRIACAERYGTLLIISTSVRLLRWQCGKRWMDRRKRKREWAWRTISAWAIYTKIPSMKWLSIFQTRYSLIHNAFLFDSLRSWKGKANGGQRRRHDPDQDTDSQEELNEAKRIYRKKRKSRGNSRICEP